MNFESLISHLNSLGWTLGNLCQTEDQWYACMVDEVGFAHGAEGTTACEAVDNAVNAPKQSWLTNRYIFESRASEKTIDLAALGLVKRKQPIERRF